MKNTFMLTWASLRTNKSQAISLLVFVAIAAALLNIGLVIFTGVDSLYDERSEANNSPHFVAFYNERTAAVGEGLQFIENHPDVSEFEEIEAVGGWANTIIGGAEATGITVFSRDCETQKMGRPSLIGDSLPLVGDAIYIPYFMFLTSGHELGDNFVVTFGGEELNFTIAGTTEEISFGSQMNGVFRFYISDEREAELREQFEGRTRIILLARLENSQDSEYFLLEYDKAVSPDGLFTTAGYELFKMARTYIAVIVAVIAIAFAILLLLVNLIVIRFRIVNSIAENMTNIGTQKAIGYKNIQISMSIVLQFALTALLGGIVGIVLSQAVIPAMTGILEPITALVWTPQFNPAIAIIAILVIVLAITVISAVTARRISKLHPLIALRGGITTHSFKKNALPLEKARGSLGFLLALKQLLQNRWQAVTICIIVAAVTMASVAGIALNYNMNENRDGLARATFGELADFTFELQSGDDAEIVTNALLEHSDVRKVFGLDYATFLVDDIRIVSYVTEDASMFEGNILLRGRYPKHRNEVTIAAVVSRVAGKGVGDTVTVRFGDRKMDYIS